MMSWLGTPINHMKGEVITPSINWKVKPCALPSVIFTIQSFSPV